MDRGNFGSKIGVILAVRRSDWVTYGVSLIQQERTVGLPLSLFI